MKTEKKAAIKTEKKVVKKAVKKPAVKDPYIKLFDLKKTDSVLDLGCGEGAFLLAAAKTAKTAVGLDCDGAALEKASAALKDNKKVILLQGYVQDWNFGDGEFSKISMKNTLRYLNNHEKGVLIHKISKWIKPGGLFVAQDMITTFALHRKDERHDMIEAECKKFYGSAWPEMRDAFYHDLYHAQPSDLSLMMHHFLFTGFNVEQIIKHTSTTCTIVARK